MLAAREALAAEPGADTETKVEVGRSLTAVADLLNSTGKTEQALATYRRSESLLAERSDANRTARAALAACRARIGFLLTRMSKMDEALIAYRRARADQEVLAAAPGTSNEAQTDLADTINWIGYLLWHRGEFSKAEDEHRAALAILNKLTDDNPRVTQLRPRIALSQNFLGNAQLLNGKLPEAEAAYSRGHGDLSEAGRRQPGRRRISQGSRFVSLQYRTDTRRDGQTVGGGCRVCARRSRACRTLIIDNPADTEFRTGEAAGQAFFGILLLQMGKPEEAEAECRTAVATLQKPGRRLPGHLENS